MEHLQYPIGRFETNKIRSQTKTKKHHRQHLKLLTKKIKS